MLCVSLCPEQNLWGRLQGFTEMMGRLVRGCEGMRGVLEAKPPYEYGGTGVGLRAEQPFSSAEAPQCTTS